MGVVMKHSRFLQNFSSLGAIFLVFLVMLPQTSLAEYDCSVYEDRLSIKGSEILRVTLSAEEGAVDGAFSQRIGNLIPALHGHGFKGSVLKRLLGFFKFTGRYSKDQMIRDFQVTNFDNGFFSHMLSPLSNNTRVLE